MQRRRHTRFLNRTVQVSWLNRGRPQPAVTVTACDISQGGIRLINRALVYANALGVVLLVRLHDEPLLRAIRVLHCHYRGRVDYHIGAQWVSLPEGLPISIRRDHLGLWLQTG